MGDQFLLRSVSTLYPTRYDKCQAYFSRDLPFSLIWFGLSGCLHNLLFVVFPHVTRSESRI